MQYESELIHHGIKGQKWGVRRYQKPDGTLTAEGKKRYLTKWVETGRTNTQPDAETDEGLRAIVKEHSKEIADLGKTRVELETASLKAYKYFELGDQAKATKYIKQMQTIHKQYNDQKIALGKKICEGYADTDIKIDSNTVVKYSKIGEMLVVDAATDSLNEHLDYKMKKIY